MELSPRSAARTRAPRGQVDLAPFMDPARRAVEAADLNLKLMRWRWAVRLTNYLPPPTPAPALTPISPLIPN